MNKSLTFLISATLVANLIFAQSNLIITGVIDGPLTGGIPKAIELYVVNNIPDLSIYGVGSANNGGGTDGEEFTFPAVAATAGQFIYVASESTAFTSFFGFAPDYTDSAANINGDDAIELFMSGTVVDIFGDINVDGTGQPWDHLDGWTYRNDSTGPDGMTFVLGNWYFSGTNALDGETTNATAATPFPIGTYTRGEIAPNVSATSPTNLEIDVAVISNIVINFTEAVNASGAWFTISGATSGAHTAVVSGGPTSYTLNPDVDFDEGEVITITTLAAQVTDVDADDPPDNMAADYVFSFTVIGPPAAVSIYEIQGSSTTDPYASPYNGSPITTTGNIVTAVGPEGFFIQTPDVDSDGNSNTSDGVYVFTTGVPTVSVGDIVDVTGTVDEFFEFTEITGPAISVTGTGATLPSAVTLDATFPSPTAPQSVIEFERLEGMLVSITGGIVNGSNQSFGSDPIAEVYITAGSSRVFRETGVEYPGAGGSIPIWDGNPEIFELDPDKLGLTNRTINAGSTFDAVGVIGYEYSGYELWPTALSVSETPLPLPVSGGTTDQFSVGALNLYRLFDTVSDGSEPVVSAAEYARRLKKFSLYIRNVLKSPDILAVSEVEKLGALQDLAAKITTDGGPSYTAYLEEGNDIGGIDVGFLVQSSRVQVDAVTQLGKNETWNDPSSGPGTLLHDRPPLILEGKFKIAGFPAVFTPISVMAIHQRSLNGINTDRVRQKRLRQAQSVAQMIQDLQVADTEINLVVVGDFNAFEFTDGYVDVLGQISGVVTPSANLLSEAVITSPILTNHVSSSPTLPKMFAPLADVSDRYSFIYQGSAQSLDHLLTSSHLTPAVTNQEFGKGNADAAINFANDDTTPLRSSDHDGIVIYIDAIDISLPVELSAFTAVENNGSVLLRWTTESETENLGFALERKQTDSEWQEIASYKTNDALLGQGSTPNATDYEYLDQIVQQGNTYEYRLADIDYNGLVTYHASRTITVNNAQKQLLPNKYSLEANYPNPFNPITNIDYSLPVASAVTITIYDMRGRFIASLVNHQQTAGYHSISWNGTDSHGQLVSAGVYLYHLKADNFQQTRKMLLIK